ncbi:MAG: nitroreductase family deazaflavin-dependent oxidoreductase [Anaerolineales bacterium]|nr:nitroreductase family deazaflavin-dependent oxidoreductase [Anaerolineales bacterium]
MSGSKGKSAGIYRWMKPFNQRMAKNYQKGFGPTRVVLLLTTTGRKSGLPRVTPLQYEQIDGVYYVGSARGPQADWFRNIQANPQVGVQIKDRQFQALAEAVTDPQRIADFFQLRLKRHPLMIGLMMRLEGLPWRYTRADLEKFAAQKALAVIRPVVEHE